MIEKIKRGEKKMDYRKYLKDFRGRSTKNLINGYHKWNDQFRRIARDELLKRRVPNKNLPWKKESKKSDGFPKFKMPRL